jgi:protein gp37
MDWLDEKVPIEWLAQFLQVALDCKNLDWLLLTKRPELFRKRIYEVSLTGGINPIEASLAHWGEGYTLRDTCKDWLETEKSPAHFWYGVSAEDQLRYDQRKPHLLATPAEIRWWSIEPLLSPIDLGDLTGISWIVVGAESGFGYRDCGVDAIVDIVKQCQNQNVPCYVKQDAAFKSGSQGRIPNDIWSIKQFPIV